MPYSTSQSIRARRSARRDDPVFEVYCHTSPSGKRYVGWTVCGWQERWRRHVEKARSGSMCPLQCAIRKYGENAFTHEVIATTRSEAEAKAFEVEWIAGLGTLVPGGYNATVGGDGAMGRKHTPEEVERMRLSGIGRKHSEETRAKIAHAASNRPLEQIEKQIAAQIGSRRSPESRARMRAAWTPEKRQRAAGMSWLRALARKTGVSL